jgi:4-amino-4-deoxy-L-arabinose transferase-like glycosyltransferase
MTTQENISQKLSLAGWLALFVSIIAAPVTTVWDETWYLSNTSELLQKGFGLQYLREFSISTGPAFAVVHAGPYAITGSSVLAARLLNLSLFALVPFLLCYLRPANGRNSLIALGGLFVSIPFFWPAMGLAMTEAPTLVFLASSLLLAQRGKTENRASAYFFAIAAGLTLGAAGLTRQTALAALPAVGWLIWHSGTNKPLRLLLFMLAALVPVALLFITWGGPIGPNLTSVGGSSLSADHAVLSYAYVGVAIAIINYRFFALSWSSRYAAGGLLLLVLIFFMLLSPDYLPARSILSRIIGNENPEWVLSVLIRGGLAVLAAFALDSMLVRLWQNRGSPIDASLLVAVICLSGSAAAVVSQFSSRYSVLAVPFLAVVIGNEKHSASAISNTLRLIGIIGGLVIFLNYSKS